VNITAINEEGESPMVTGLAIMDTDFSSIIGNFRDNPRPRLLWIELQLPIDAKELVLVQALVLILVSVNVVEPKRFRLNFKGDDDLERLGARGVELLLQLVGLADGLVGKGDLVSTIRRETGTSHGESSSPVGIAPAASFKSLLSQSSS
jgi:hypothetical protein